MSQQKNPRMRDEINKDDIVVTVRLMRQQFQGCLVIVEGESDFCAFTHLLSNKTCFCIDAHGKENALGALSILENQKFPGVLAIVDADFYPLWGDIPTSSNVMITDSHDLETMILASPALDKLLTEMASPDKLQLFLSESGNDDIRSTLCERGKVIGYLRLASLTHELNLKFKGLTYSDFVDDKTLSVNISKLVKAVKNTSRQFKLQEQDLINKIQDIYDNNHDLWVVCCGHDLVNILVIGLRRAFGSCKSVEINQTTVERGLRLAYAFSEFAKTKLFEALKTWEKNNSPYRIFPVY